MLFAASARWARRVLDHDVLSTRRPEAPAELRHLQHVEAAEVGDEERRGGLDGLGQHGDFRMPFNLAHRYPAVSSLMPGPIVALTVAERT